MITIENKGSEIELFGRNKEKGMYTHKVIDFKPYFYKEDNEGKYKSIGGVKLKKVIVNDPKNVKEVRGKYKHHEADIIYTNRYIIDRIKKIEKEPIRICYLDIETASTEKGFEEPILANNPIISVCWYDSFDKGYEQFWVNEKHSEKDMLNEFIQYIKQSDPDMLVAWNGCFVNGTNILMSNGKYKKIEKIKIGDEVIGYNKKSIKTKVKNIFKHKRYKQIYKIKIKNKELFVSEEHPLLVSYDKFFGYKKVPELRVGDFLTEFKELEIDNEKHDLKIEDYKFAGLIITDGHLDKKFNRIAFYNKNKKICKFVENYLCNKNIKFWKKKYLGCNHYNITNKGLKYMLEGLGVPRGCKSKNSFIDLSNIFIQDKKRIKSFMDGVYLGDGTKNKKRNWITCYNKQMREWFVKLYKRIGIYSYESKTYLDKHNSKQGIFILSQEYVPYYFVSNSEIKTKRNGIVSDIVNRNIPCTRKQYDKHFNGENISNLHFEKILDIEKIIYNDYVYNFETETHNYIANDYIVHNCGFDFPMIINRMKKLGIDPKEIGRGGNVSAFKKNDRVFSKCYGRILFDLMSAYKKHFSMGGRESWSLDYISKYELKEGKEEYKGELDDLFKTDIKKFLKYNQRDVELLVMLDEKLQIINFFDEIRRLAFCKFEDVFMNSKTADCLCLRYAKEHEFVLPSVQQHLKESYEGGYVKESEPKLHKSIGVMDMKSLYPSVIIGFNTSPECLDINGKINVHNKYKYKEQQGIIPAIVKPLLNKRAETKKQMRGIDINSQEYKSFYIRQYAQKVIANAFYGCLGFRHFRLYKKEVAESVTYIARMIIKEVVRWFEAKGFKIIYGDTDSIFISMEDKTIEDMEKLKNEVNLHFKTYFKQFGVQDKNNVFELEFEKVYRTIFFKLKADGKGAKKRYAGQLIWKDGKEIDKFDLVGFESRRSDSPQVGRDFMKQVLKMICNEKSKEEIDKFVEDFKIKIKGCSAEEIGLPIGISKRFKEYKNTPIHIRASKNANERHNAQIKKGDKIKYVFVKDSIGVIAFKGEKWMWDGYEIDYDKMQRRIVDLKIGPLYESLGWDYPYLEFKTNKKQKIIKFEDTLKQEELW